MEPFLRSPGQAKLQVPTSRGTCEGQGGGRQDVPGGQRGLARRVGAIPLVLPGLRGAAAGLRHLPPAAAVKAAPGQGLRDGPPGLEFGAWFPIPRGIVKMLSRHSHKAVITRCMFEGQHAPLRAARGARRLQVAGWCCRKPCVEKDSELPLVSTRQSTVGDGVSGRGTRGVPCPQPETQTRIIPVLAPSLSRWQALF